MTVVTKGRREGKILAFKNPFLTSKSETCEGDLVFPVFMA
jgi:hypothetical protein